MPLLLRKIDHKVKWAKGGEASKYLPPEQAPADVLHDLKTEDNRLSVWQIEDDKSNLTRVIAAIVSTREYLQKLDYILIDFRHIQENGLRVERESGDTLDKQANSWHVDVIQLSASDLARLANLLFANGERVRELEPQLLNMLRQSVNAGHIHEAELKPTVAQKLQV